jgi:hypothetical protein
MPTNLGDSSSHGAGTPPAPPGSSTFNPCHTCGGCTFSEGSSLEVEKHEFTCAGFPPVLTDTTTTETWPFDSADASKVRYELDADNWAEYSCSSNSWSYSSENVGVRGGSCISSTTPPWQLDKCSGFEVRAYVNGVSQLLIRATRKNNNCIPVAIA